MDQMKQTVPQILFLVAAFVLCNSCGGGDDQPAPNSQAQNPSGTNQPTERKTQVPTIDEASITYDAASNTIYFHGTRPAGTKIQVQLFRQTDETEEQVMDVSYSAGGQFYFVNVASLTPGAAYSYYVIGYDSKGKESFKSAENTFTMPKEASPQPPVTSGIQAYAPTTLHGTDGYLEGEVITTAMEYSTDGGETCTAVTEAGFIRNLAPGKVQLRWAETPTTEAGMAAEVKVPEYHSNTDPEGTGGSSEGMRAKRDVIR